MMTRIVMKRMAQALGVMVLGGLGNAVAGPVVTQWGYSADARFVDSRFSGSTGEILVSDSELSWGSDAYFQRSNSLWGWLFGTGQMVTPDFRQPSADAEHNRSALTIGNGVTNDLTGGGPAVGSVATVVDGSADDAAEIGVGTSLTHWNNRLSSRYSTLEWGRVATSLTLTPELPASGASIDTRTLDFEFFFKETANQGTCAGDSTNPCPDLFGLLAVQTLDIPFLYDGNEYLVSLLLQDASGGVAPIATLHEEECAALGLGAGCQGFRTAEAQATTFQFAFAVSTEALFPPVAANPVQSVPLPAPLGLIGGGLLAAGLSRRLGRRGRQGVAKTRVGEDGSRPGSP
ncbi:THxN family PEP-CTERM protein [Marichromatium gracile]|uniref:THxN family PEP-CTERM protein n=1 Tax=Marichromatium gracile TaxID=1048 RepID=UPI001F30C9C8|nr:THxN family PEP-CTERM protein [Marichromatium gracile]MCF1184744.1 THxN family PEP-CTERM protein [Marichromatium gracile]